MSDFDELIISTAAMLHREAQHASRLGTGLQNVAPAQSVDQTNHSIQYLQAMGDVLEKASKECLLLGPLHLQETADKSEEK
jgi:hypothetical protein